MVSGQKGRYISPKTVQFKGKTIPIPCRRRRFDDNIRWETWQFAWEKGRYGEPTANAGKQRRRQGLAKQANEPVFGPTRTRPDLRPYLLLAGDDRGGMNDYLGIYRGSFFLRTALDERVKANTKYTWAQAVDATTGALVLTWSIYDE